MGERPWPSEVSRSLPLPYGSVTLEEALNDDDNMLLKVRYPEQRIDFFSYLYKNITELEAIVSYHLGCNASYCKVGGVREWIAGSFNVCIPVYIDERAGHLRKRVFIRVPLPYKVGEARFPGHAEEKVRCEAATFIWLQENCSASVSIPFLWGFGFPNGQSFTTPKAAPLFSRLSSSFRRSLLRLLGRPIPSQYIIRKCSHNFGISYLLMDYIEETEGQMLSLSWEELRHDIRRRTNLFRGISRIMHAMSNFPFHRIGSLTIDDSGVSSLTNRPLTLRLQHLENEGIPTDIDRGTTYSSSETYAVDLLRCHDSRLRWKPNSIRDDYDARAQMAVLAAMRAIYPHFLDRKLRNGPFVFTLTDLHQSNIFVDEDWNIKYVVDLEWACSLPIEMLHPPYWLTSRGVDQLEKGEDLEEYNRIRTEFIQSYEREEQAYPQKGRDLDYRTSIMKRGWDIGNFWYFQALDSPKGLCNIFLQHIQPIFEASHVNNPAFDRVVTRYWAPDEDELIRIKTKDKQAYDDELRQEFAAGHVN